LIELTYMNKLTYMNRLNFIHFLGVNPYLSKLCV